MGKGHNVGTNPATHRSLTIPLQNHYQSYLALTVHKKTLIFCGLDFCLSPSISVVKAHRTVRLKYDSSEWTVWHKDSGLTSRVPQRMWYGGTLGPVYPGLWTLPGTTGVCVARKMSRKEGQSGDSGTKQSVTLCAVVHPFQSLLSISLSPPFSLSNWCPQSCVSPHLPALKLHQPYLLLSLSMIIIIIIVIIVVIMVRIAVIACYF